MLRTISEVGFFNYFFSFYREFPLTITVFCILSFVLGAVVTFLALRHFPFGRSAPDQDLAREGSPMSPPEEIPSIPGQSPPPGSRNLEHITDGWELPGVPAKAKSALATVLAGLARRSKKPAE